MAAASKHSVYYQAALRSRGLRHIVHFLMAIILVGLLALCIFFGWNYFKDKQDRAREARSATVTASIKDDLAAHTILIPGEEGSQIYIRELRASYIVAGGFATVDVLDHIWYDDVTDFVGDTMEVTLTPFVKTASGQQKPLDPITYDISIPLSPITLISPDGLRTEVATAMYSMQFAVRPGSTVFINDKDVSDTVNAKDGRFTYNATVQPIGDNNFEIRVRSQYCRENIMSVTLYRERQEIPLDLAADTISSTSKEHIDIHATTMPGAVVEVLSPHTDLNITEMDTTGAFTFEAVFDHIGYNTIVITSAYEGKKTSRVEYQVYYLPTQDIYTRKAWPLNKQEEYTELLNNLDFRAANTQIYEVRGTVAYLVSEKPQMAVINTSEDGQNRPVLLENFTKTTWEVGQSYRIFGDVYSSYNNMPWLAARYTYALK